MSLVYDFIDRNTKDLQKLGGGGRSGKNYGSSLGIGKGLKLPKLNFDFSLADPVNAVLGTGQQVAKDLGINTDQDLSKVDLSFGHSLNLDQTLPDNTPNWDQLKPNLDQDLSKISVRGLQESAVKQAGNLQNELIKIGTAGQEAAVQAGKAGQQALVDAGSAAQTNFQTLGTDLQREAVNFGSAFQQEVINLGSGAQKMAVEFGSGVQQKAVEFGSGVQQAAIDIASLTGIRNETVENYIAQITGGTEGAGQQVTKGAEFVADKATKGVEFVANQITKGAELLGGQATKGAENVIAQATKGAESQAAQVTKYMEEKVIPAVGDAYATAYGDKNPQIKFIQGAVKDAEKNTKGIEALPKDFANANIALANLVFGDDDESSGGQITTGDNLSSAPTIGDEAVFPEMEQATTKAGQMSEEDRLRKIRRLMMNRYGREKTILGSPGDTISRRRYAL